MSDIDIYVGRALRNIRQTRGECPERLSNIISTNLETYSAYENGLKPIPAATLIDLAIHFRVSVSYFLDGYRIAKEADKSAKD